MKQFSLSELNRRSGELADAALVEPIALTKHGKRKLVLLSADLFERMAAGLVPSEAGALASGTKIAGRSKLANLRRIAQEEEVDTNGEF